MDKELELYFRASRLVQQGRRNTEKKTRTCLDCREKFDSTGDRRCPSCNDSTPKYGQLSELA